MTEPGVAQGIKATAYAGGPASYFLTFVNEYAAALGVLLTLCALIMNWIYNHRRDKREAEKLERLPKR